VWHDYLISKGKTKMNDFNGQYSSSRPTVQDMSMDMGLRAFMLGIYQKMGIGLVVTGLMAYFVAQSPMMLSLLYRFDGNTVVGYTLLGYVAAFAPLVLVLVSNFFLRTLNTAVLALFYWAFVAIIGVSLSSVFLLYTGVSIGQIFFVTAAAFGALSLWGYTTKVNMTGWGNFLIMAVVGIIIASLANMFIFKSGMFDLVLACIGVLIFSGLIAYKTQMLKDLYYDLGGNTQRMAAMTYYGALSLYISFINLFLSLLRIFGGRR